MTLNTHCGMVAIVGRPNVGKSTLLNCIVEQKVSITSRKPQTTRHRILGIHTEDNYQAVYVDTPGLHSEEKRAINRLMNRAASSSIGDVEMILFVVEGTHWTSDDEMVLNKIKNSGHPIFLIINKADNVKDKEDLIPHVQWLHEKGDFAGIIPISAKTGKNVDLVKAEVRKRLPECEFYFPEDYVTDRSMRFLAAEIVREKLMRFMGDELPYSVTVEIEQFKWQDNGVWQINALILVERESQKRMVIGNKGEKLKVIGREARKDLEAMLDNKVFLELWVKVKSGWADDERALRSLGYGED
ncbi:GTPase Era [Pseudoalteromonas xiamenensis]|uniref:GTPase Era n=1 Tax=Pseudoalteromonas xiamenensis TaxID=882626 RepID=A0A975DG76_9GAMM|nr:GTPase Era [Pseudoalteromonas xiamenensis]QTH70994.1 GTPase Era [Pseudoalteromonas xiamenensis]